MKKLIFLTGVCLIVGSGLIELIRHDTGYLLIKLGSTTIETSLWVALSTLLLCALALYLCIRFTKHIFSVLYNGVSFFSNHRLRSAASKSDRGLMHFIEGDWRRAQKELLSCVKSTQKPLIHYLAATHCACELNDTEEAKNILESAKNTSEADEASVAIMEAKVQFLEKDYKQSLTTLNRVPANAHHPVAIHLKGENLWQLEDWESLIALLPQLHKSGAMLHSDEFEEKVYIEWLKSETKKLDTHSDAEKMNTLWLQLPKKIREKNTARIEHVKQLMDFNKHEDALSFVKSSIKNAWCDPLVTLFSQIQTKDPKKQLSVAESWLKQHSNNPILLCSLAKICVANEQWEKAKDYYETSLKYKESADTYLALGQLVSHLGDHDKSTELFVQGLQLKTSQTIL